MDDVMSVNSESSGISAVSTNSATGGSKPVVANTITSSMNVIDITDSQQNNEEEVEMLKKTVETLRQEKDKSDKRIEALLRENEKLTTQLSKKNMKIVELKKEIDNLHEELSNQVQIEQSEEMEVIPIDDSPDEIENQNVEEKKPKKSKISKHTLMIPNLTELIDNYNIDSDNDRYSAFFTKLMKEKKVRVHTLLHLSMNELQSSKQSNSFYLHLREGRKTLVD